MTKALGSSVTYPQQYAPEVLEFIPRSPSRVELFGNSATPFHGTDVWTCYEFSWLTADGSPEAAVLRLEYPSESSHIVESKSLKLYLGSFSFTSYPSKNDVVTTIKKDLTKGLGTETLQLKLIEPDAEELNLASSKGYCIDIHSVKNPTFSYNPTFLRAGTEVRDELMYTNLFRSLCPVTGQPDWATISILYNGHEIIPEDLSRYLISLRSHQGFHESCCELIFRDILSQCAPHELSVMCSFTRRGGIDITPIRTTKGMKGIAYRRVRRQ